MKFGYTILYVPDVLAAIEFYEKAFGQKRLFLHGDEYGQLDTGGTALAFAIESLAKANGFDVHENRSSNLPAAAEIVFVSDTIEADWERALAAGAVPLQPPTQKSWGQTICHVRDLNGFLVEICTPMG